MTTKTPEPLMRTEDFLKFITRAGYAAVGVLLLAAISSCCLGGSGHTERSMEACREMCGEHGVQSWSAVNGCECRPSDVQEYCMDRCDLFCEGEPIDVD